MRGCRGATRPFATSPSSCGRPRCAGVRSFEHDPGWVSIDEFEDQSFDLVMVDGLYRPDLPAPGGPKVKPGGLLVLNDTDVRQLVRLRRSALPTWMKASYTGFKAPKDIRETMFFHCPDSRRLTRWPERTVPQFQA